MLKGRLCTAQETLANSEMESKASRETINRLVSEVNSEQSVASKFKQELEHINRVCSCPLLYNNNNIYNLHAKGNSQFSYLANL